MGLRKEERKWKRILGKATTLLLQDKNKKAITKVRIYGDRIAIQSLLFLYVISHMFERTATIAGFLLYLTEKEIDYEILEKDVEQNTI